MTIKILTAVILLCLVEPDCTKAALNPAASGSKAGYPEISPDSIKKHIRVLSHDSLGGRAAGTEGGSKAAGYIASCLEKYGLQPGNRDRTYYQYIPFRGIKPGPADELTLYFNDESLRLNYGSDFLIYSSGTDNYIPQGTELVFTGYGIVAPEYDYNDYQSVNVEGRVVVLLSGEPHSDDPGYFHGSLNTLHSQIEIKQRVALSRGARGVVMIMNPYDRNLRSWDYYSSAYSFEQVSLAYSRNEIPGILLSPQAAEKLLSRSRFTMAEIFSRAESNSLISFPTGARLSLHSKSLSRSFTSPNIIAFREGTHPKLRDTYILISAHYDHLGTGKPVKGDSVYNGAIDNASGTAALLEIARAFSRIQTSRSIVFLFTTAEEKGLLGSAYYTDNPVFPLYKTSASVNIDGLSFFDSTLSFIPVGAEFSSLDEFFGRVCLEMNVRKESLPAAFNSSESFTNSDQFSFARAGIPSVIIAEGTEYKKFERSTILERLLDWMETVYHSPSDEANDGLNYNAMAQHADIIFSFARQLSLSPVNPEWKKGSPFINARLNSIAEKR